MGLLEFVPLGRCTGEDFFIFYFFVCLAHDKGVVDGQAVNVVHACVCVGVGGWGWG
jgi:hypothetical protein